MPKREPAPVAILSARIMRAYPSLSAYSAAFLATDLQSIERAQQRHAERCCNGADGGYVRRLDVGRANAAKVRAERLGTIACLVEHDPDAEQRAGERIERRVGRWRDALAKLTDTAMVEGGNCAIELQGDPRGAVLLLRLPGEAEAVSV